MITISTGGIGPMDIMANTKSKGTSKEEEKAVDAFASLMNMVSAKQEQTDFSSTQDVDVTEVAPTESKIKDYDAYSKQNTVDSSKDKLQNTENSVAKEDTKANAVKEADVEAGEDTNAQKAVELVKDVKDALKEALGITDEELESILADMGIDVTQLLTGDNLKNFILQAIGAENVDILVNENIAKLVSDITNKVTMLVNEYGFSEVNQAGEFLEVNAAAVEVALKNVDENVDISTDIAVDKEVVSGSDEVVDETFDMSDEADASKVNNKSHNQLNDGGLADKITVEGSTDSGDSASKGQTSEQNNNQQIISSFNQALDNTVNANVSVDATAFSANVQEADIIRQIIDQIKVTATNEVQSMEIQLNPENLGKVYVNVEAKDGVMQAKIIAETEAAKNAIENNLAILKENFSNNEIKVEAIEVMVAAYGFFEESQNGDSDNQEQTNDTSKAIGSINVNDLGEEELTEEEELEVEIMKSKGNTVSYTV
ncbi:MAG: flagellar hook-length control protein FliK [Lachnospiraceae bacterium]|nr:flagellar hook-length control protein FliK [Lachnospiraceae bacterium]